MSTVEEAFNGGSHAWCTRCGGLIVRGHTGLGYWDRFQHLDTAQDNDHRAMHPIGLDEKGNQK